MRYIILLPLFLLAACQNPYSKFYNGVPDARTISNYEPISGDIQIYPTNDFDKDSRALMRKGFMLLGNSSFNAASNAVSNEQIKEQARIIGAEVVLVKTRYTHTVSGAMPLTLPNNSTSYSTGSATAYGSGGVVNAYGSSTTTTYGTQTVMMPYQVQHSDFGALYFAKYKTRLGLVFGPQSETDVETRKRIGTNAGIIVFEVINGSPAFKANVFPGDVLISIGDSTVSSSEDYKSLLDRYEGQSVSIKLYRDGKTFSRKVKILTIAKNEDERKE